jgi:pimeloyl-ACP methyl ester carboxylesterase
MIEAVVQTGTFETSYRRAGTGGTVLLLAGTVDAGDWLFDQLALHFRIVAPVLPMELDSGSGDNMAGSDRGLEGWLRGLIDGLGLERPAVVAGAARGAGLLRFMALDPDRVRQMVLIYGAQSGLAPGHVLLEDPVPGGPQPVLVIGFPGPGDPDGRMAALHRMVTFLGAP